MTEPSFYWHDYETFGTDPQRDQACQFAGIRTDHDFNIIGEPLTIYCKPSADCLPHPDACIITGITPQLADSKGVCEADFIRLIHEQLAQPSTCVVGYNNLRFDDEVTRNLLYRNFYDPYAREWRNNNSRWDLIDVVRAARALRPDGIEWPVNEEGRPSFRLEDLTRANGIEHTTAHDALSDVHATIAMAKLIRQQQPKLYRFLFQHRVKQQVIKLMQLGSYTPLVHVSGMYPAVKHCLAVVVPLCEHPENSNGVIVYDLSVDPAPLLELSAEQIKQRVFTASGDLPDDVDRIPLKTVHVNKCPVLAPLPVIREADALRLDCDLARCHANLERIKQAGGLVDKLNVVFTTDFDNSVQDPDLMIYSGGFFAPHDKAEMSKVRQAKPEQLPVLQTDFHDRRLAEMLFRYKGRNFPQTLTEEERRRWRRHCAEVMYDEQVGAALTLPDFLLRLQRLRLDHPGKNPILADLQAFAEAKQRQFAPHTTD
ncbi:exodeoxyribonuclease I [Methylomarinum sp. Ch1-1]|uniref:Exodeoxyribonuclease I n=1 Tax=Methylomarinum roseum TaxID=3067653 RepID=A0AAU7NQ96_9GAMM|nr:exodeoxyribonuclease I [Methylomarinum sp. Ch1-1]MDP4520951.1 exodeoxyribonuclease I [Methylomarinum sp. Ch1-1]